MAVITTELTRVGKRERKQRQTNNAKSALLQAAGLILVLALGVIIAVGPRISSGTAVLGKDLSRMSVADAAATLQQSFEASSAVSFVAQGKHVSRTLAEAGLRPDFGAIARQASSYTWWLGMPAKWQYRGEVDASKFSALVKEIDAELPRPKDARFVVTADQIRIEPSSLGVAVDAEGLKERLWDLLKSPAAAVDVPLAQVAPSRTTEAAQAMNLNRLLGSYTTMFVEDKSRSENIRLAASRLSGTILAPGQTISFNDTVGPRGEEHGYKEANVFIGNKIEKGYGGGVCQVSTTLYNAALLSNLEIIERHPHSMTVDYVPLGQDASVVYDLMDLVFKNNTTGHIMVMAEIKTGVLTFRIFGDGPEVNVKIEPTVLSKTDFKTETVLDPTLPPGTQQIAKGKTGYKVATYRVVTDSRQQVTRTLLNYSTYRPMTQIIKAGNPQ